MDDDHAPARRRHCLNQRRKHLNYRDALAKELPIGSGEIESAHRYIAHPSHTDKLQQDYPCDKVKNRVLGIARPWVFLAEGATTANFRRHRFAHSGLASGGPLAIAPRGRTAGSLSRTFPKFITTSIGRPTVNAQAHIGEKGRSVRLYGGLGRHRWVGVEGVAFALAHETGQILKE